MIEWSLVAKLLASGESDSLDWKADYPQGLLGSSKVGEWDKGKATLLKDLISIANGEGCEVGHLVYGVKDHGADREVIGVAKSWDDADFQGWAANAFDPPPTFLFGEAS